MFVRESMCLCNQQLEIEILSLHFHFKAESERRAVCPLGAHEHKNIFHIVWVAEFISVFKNYG